MLVDVLVEQLSNSSLQYCSSGFINKKVKPLVAIYGEVGGYNMPDNDSLDIFVLNTFATENLDLLPGDTLQDIHVHGFIPYTDSNGVFDPKLVGIHRLDYYNDDFCESSIIKSIDRLLLIYRTKSGDPTLKYIIDEHNIIENIVKEYKIKE